MADARIVDLPLVSVPHIDDLLEIVDVSDVTDDPTGSSVQIALGKLLDWSFIQNKPSTFTPTSHTHSLSDLTQSSATNGQVPSWNGSAWVPITVTSGVSSFNTRTGTVTLTSGDVTTALGYSDIARTSQATRFIDELTASTGNGVHQTTRFGRGAGASVIAGSGPNTLIGEGAGSSVTTGYNNTFIGFDAGSVTTTGEGNVIVGSQSTIPATASTMVVIGRSNTVTSSHAVVCVGVATDIAHNNIVALGTFAHSIKDGQMITGRNISTWTFNHLSTTDTRACAELQRAWADSTDATRAGRLTLHAYYTTTAQEGIRIDANSGGARLGFNGSSAIAKPTVTGSRGSNAALASLLTALANYGLITDSSS